MAGRKTRKRIKRRLTLREVKRILTHSVVREVLELILILGILYFGISGFLTVALNTESYWMGVISDSMKHDASVDWEKYFTDRGARGILFRQRGLSQVISEDHLYNPEEFPIRGGFTRGDLVIIKGVNSVSEISVGDVLIIKRNHEIPLTHRVLAVWEENGKIRFTTKGDYNGYLLGDDAVVYPEQVVGKVVFVIPKLGNISLWFQGK